MTDYTFSGSGSQTIPTFNPSTDDLIIGSSVGNAASLQVSGNTTFTATNGSSVTLADIAADQLTTANLVFAGGSELIIGANSTTPALDALSNAHTLTGTGGNQVLELGGNDTIVDNTTAGGNFIRGGSGNDNITLSATATNDTVISGAGASTITAATDTGNVTIWGANYAAYSGVGTPAGGADSITGGLGSNYIHGSTGNATITGTAGHTGIDTIIAGHGNDSITGQTGDSNLLEGGKGSDTIVDDGTTGHDTVSAGLMGVVGGAGNGFSLTVGNGKDNVAYGDGGNGTINSGTGIGNTIHGGAGADSIVSQTSGTSITGSTFDLEKGNSTISSSTSLSFDTINGGSGTDDVIVKTAASETQSLDVLIGSGATALNDTSTGDQGTVNFIEQAGISTGVDTYTIQLNAATLDLVNIIGGLKTTDVVDITQNTNFGGGTDTISVSANTLVVQNVSTTGGTLTISNLDTAGSILSNNTGTFSTLYYNYGSTGATLGSSSATTNNAIVSDGTGSDTIYTGTSGTDSIYASANANDLVIHTSTSSDTIHALASADTLEMSGADSITHLGTNITGFAEVELVGSGTKTLTIAGTLVGGAISSGSTVTIDGSGSTGAITLTASANETVNLYIKGGSANAEDLNPSDTAASTGNMTIIGGNGNSDTLAGGAGIDSIVAGNGTGDILSATGTGSASNLDTLVAGTGPDEFTGATGYTEFKFPTTALGDTTLATTHVIVNFTDAGGDVIGLPSASFTHGSFSVGAAINYGGGADPASVAALLLDISTPDSATPVYLAAADGVFANPGGFTHVTALNDAFLLLEDNSGNKSLIYLEAPTISGGAAHTFAATDFVFA